MTQSRDVFSICAGTPPDIKSRVASLEALGWRRNPDPVAYDTAMRCIPVLSEIDFDAPFETFNEVKAENDYLDVNSVLKKENDLAMVSQDGGEFIAITEGLGGYLNCMYTSTTGKLTDIFAGIPDLAPSVNGPFQYATGGYLQASVSGASLEGSDLAASLYFRTVSNDRVPGWKPAI